MDYLELVFDRYNENRAQARDQFQLPPWSPRFWIDARWIGADEASAIDPTLSRVVIEMRYAHKGGRCYQIREYCVYDQRVTVRTGTVELILRIDKPAIVEARIFALRFLADATLQALANYHNPTGGTVAGFVDIGLMAAGSAVPPVFGDLLSGISMGQLLDEINDITDKVDARLRELDRIESLDGSVLATYRDVAWRRRSVTVRTCAPDEIVEVECADWILQKPEGEVFVVPEHNEQVYPPLPLEDEVERELRDIRESLRGHTVAPPGSLQRVKSLVERLRKLPAKPGNNRP